MEKVAVAKSFSDGVRASIPTALGYVSIGIACGVVGASSGLSPLEMGLMSAIVYGGSAQFAMCALLLVHAPVVSVVITVFLVNLRNFLMSLHATTIFKDNALGDNILIGTLITDESYGVLLGEVAHNETITSRWMHGNNVMGYISWVLAVTISTYLGQYIPNPEQFGLDFALVGMFIAIFAAQLDSMRLQVPMRKIALILLVVAISYVLSSVVLSESMSVLVATLIGCGVGVMLDEA